MPPLGRRLLVSFAAIAVLFVLVGSLGWWTIHTVWFANLVRSRIVTALQDATGGRVEIGTFGFNPDTLHARFANLIIHGKEPSGAPALLSVAGADIGLKVLSLAEQDVDVESIIISKPEIHITINTDGTTNVPTPKRPSASSPLQELLDLKAKHIEVRQGMIQVNDRKIPLDFKAQRTGLALDYNRDGPSYGISLDIDDLQASVLKTPLRPMHIFSRARLFQDRADIQSFQLITGKNSSAISLSGKIEHFARPLAHADVDASLSVDELAQFAEINQQLRNGKIGVKGVADFNADSNRFDFKGTSEARGVDFVSPGFTLRDISANAIMIANNDGLLLQHARATGRGAHFIGEAVIKGYQFLQVHGQVSDVSLHEVGSYLTSQPFPWAGTAHGEAHASAKLGDPQPDFVIGAKVDIESAEAGIPTSGNVEVNYYDRLTRVEFGPSTLNLPHTKGAFQGTLDGDLSLKADSTDLADLQPLIPILSARVQPADIPQFARAGAGHFDGILHNLMHQAAVKGDLGLSKFKFREYVYDSLSGQVSIDAQELAIHSFHLQQADASLTGSASAQLSNWVADDNLPVELTAKFANLDVLKTISLFTTASPPLIKGFASGSLALQGSINHPRGVASVQILNLDAFGEQLNQAQFDAALDGNRLQVSKGRVEAGQAQLTFSGLYQHNPADWSTGDIVLKGDSNGFPLSSLATIQKLLPSVNGRAEIHLDTVGKLRRTSFEPLQLNGTAQVQHVSVKGRELGNVSLTAVTQGKAIDFKYSGALHDTNFHGAAHAQLTIGTPVRGEVQLDRISFATAKALLSDTKVLLPLDGFLEGGVVFDGLLEEPAQMHARASIKTLQINSLPRLATSSATGIPDIVLRNNEPILIDVSDGTLSVVKFEIDGRDTSVKISGSAPFIGSKPVDIRAVGNANLGILILFDPNVRSSGSSELEANITGTIVVPNISGTLKIRSGSFFFSDIPNGLSEVDGTVAFNKNRATIQKMTAHSGGGDISVGGSISFDENEHLVYHLEAAARNVRVRYANSISVTANSDLRLTGTSNSSLLSGSLTVTRVVFNPNSDVGSLLAAVSSSNSAPSNPEDFIAGLHLDVGVESAPNLQVSTNLSRDVEAEIQLHLRGSPDHPIVLGNITANQGDIKIFGTRFSLNRGEVSFVNTVRVEPVVDLDLETQTRGVTVDITISGPPSKLNFNYRSDPPLQPRDIIALLTVGRAPDVGSTSNAQGNSDATALTSGVNSVLGQAIAPVSNRLSKLFGITNIKIDPFVQGITNTPQARLSVEQQISRDVTVTYITNLSQTSEQIFRFEWALNRQFSIVALRDDNGEFGVDFQYKKRFK